MIFPESNPHAFIRKYKCPSKLDNANPKKNDDAASLWDIDNTNAMRQDIKKATRGTDIYFFGGRKCGLSMDGYWMMRDEP